MSDRADALLIFLVWEKNCHEDDISAITSDIHIILKKYPELMDTYLTHQNDRGFLKAKDV